MFGFLPSNPPPKSSSSKKSKSKDSKSKTDEKKQKKVKTSIQSKDITSALGKTKEKENGASASTETSSEFKFLDTVEIDAKRLAEDRATIGQNILNFEAPVATTDALLRSTDTSKDLSIALDYIKSLASNKRKSSSSSSGQPAKKQGERQRGERGAMLVDAAVAARIDGAPHHFPPPISKLSC